MNADILTFIKRMRYRLDMSALIPIDCVMGIPLPENSKIFIPFFTVLSGSRCMAEAELVVEYPSCTILSFRRLTDNKIITYDGAKMRALKKYLQEPHRMTDSGELILKIRDISDEMASIYEKAMEEL